MADAHGRTVYIGQTSTNDTIPTTKVKAKRKKGRLPTCDGLNDG